MNQNWLWKCLLPIFNQNWVSNDQIERHRPKVCFQKNVGYRGRIAGGVCWQIRPPWQHRGSRVSDLNPSGAVIVCGTIFLVCLITQPTLRTRVTSSGAGYTNSLLISYFCLDFTNFCTIKYPIELIGDICTVRTVGHEDRMCRDIPNLSRMARLLNICSIHSRLGQRTWNCGIIC